MLSKTRLLVMAVIFFGAALMSMPAQNTSPTVATAKREILLQATRAWNGKAFTRYPTGQPQLTTLKITLAPHTSIPWHTHPVPNSVYVLAGTLTLHDRDGGQTFVVHQGEAAADPVEDVHDGESGSEPTVLIMTFAGAPGLPTSTAVPAPAASPAAAMAKREILLQATQSWNGKPYTHYPTGQPQVTTIQLTIAPHTVLPWHTHPIPNSVYVLAGTLTLHDRDSGKTLVIHHGQAVGESVNDVHRGESGSEPTVLIITYAGAPGVPTSIPAKGEAAEY